MLTLHIPLFQTLERMRDLVKLDEFDVNGSWDLALVPLLHSIRDSFRGGLSELPIIVQVDLATHSVYVEYSCSW